MEGGVKPVTGAIIDGVTGALLNECIYQDIDVLCLLTPTHTNFPVCDHLQHLQVITL